MALRSPIYRQAKGTTTELVDGAFCAAIAGATANIRQLALKMMLQTMAIALLRTLKLLYLFMSYLPEPWRVGVPVGDRLACQHVSKGRASFAYWRKFKLSTA